MRLTFLYNTEKYITNKLFFVFLTNFKGALQEQFAVGDE